MAASQMAMCSSQALQGGGLCARKSSCFCGASSRPHVLGRRSSSCSSEGLHHGLVVRAQEARKGTRIFKFSSKKDAPEPLETAGAPGTRLFQFGAKKQVEVEEEEASQDPNFGTQIFKTLSSFGPNKEDGGKGGALVPKSKASPALPFSLPRRQDPKTVFVTGATGQIGARIVQKLLRQGFSVRAGVRDLFAAQQLAEFATQYGVVSREEAKRLNAVEFDFKNVESIAKAIGGAAKVVVTIGPTEDGPKSKVSFEDASNIVDAAKLANIASLVVVYEPGTSRGDENPLTGLASFFTELFSKPVAVSISELLNQIVDSDLSYTLLKTSLTEGVDDISATAQNIELRKEGSPVFSESTKISKGQVASIVAEVLINPAVGENKVIEACTTSSAAAIPISELLGAIPVDALHGAPTFTTAIYILALPLQVIEACTTSSAAAIPISELLGAIPVDGRREALAAARAKAAEEEREKAAREKAEADARAAVEDARKASQLAAQLEAEAKQLAAEEAKAASLAERAQAQAAAAAASVEGLASRIKDLPEPQLFAKAGASAVPTFSLPAFPTLSSTKTPPRSKPAASAPPPPPPPKKKQQREQPRPSAPTATSKPQVNSIFGGLFTQETVYIDEV